MKLTPRLFPVLVVFPFLILPSCQNAPAPGASPALSFGTPSYSHLSDSGRKEAVIAFEHAKNFIAAGAVDPQTLDLAHPLISHYCPGMITPVYDWAVSFPSHGSDTLLTIAVINDGACWALQ